MTRILGWLLCFSVVLLILRSLWVGTVLVFLSVGCLSAWAAVRRPRRLASLAVYVMLSWALIPGFWRYHQGRARPSVKVRSDARHIQQLVDYIALFEPEKGFPNDMREFSSWFRNTTRPLLLTSPGGFREVDWFEDGLMDVLLQSPRYTCDNEKVRGEEKEEAGSGDEWDYIYVRPLRERGELQMVFLTKPNRLWRNCINVGLLNREVRTLQFAEWASNSRIVNLIALDALKNRDAPPR